MKFIMKENGVKIQTEILVAELIIVIPYCQSIRSRHHVVSELSDWLQIPTLAPLDLVSDVSLSWPSL